MMRDKKNAANTAQYWKCQDRSCRGRASSAILEDGIISLELEDHKPHTSCEPNPALVSKKKRIQQLKEMAIDNPTAPASQLIERMKQPLTMVEKMSLPSNHGLEMHVNRARKPVGASMIDCDPADIVWHDIFTKTERDDTFLFYDSRESEPEKPFIIIFASTMGIQLLKSYPEWAIDGTLFVAPWHFIQLYTLNVFFKHCTFSYLTKMKRPIKELLVLCSRGFPNRFHRAQL
jgi:hypothetical protein